MQKKKEKTVLGSHALILFLLLIRQKTKKLHLLSRYVYYGWISFVRVLHSAKSLRYFVRFIFFIIFVNNFQRMNRILIHSIGYGFFFQIKSPCHRWWCGCDFYKYHVWQTHEFRYKNANKIVSLLKMTRQKIIRIVFFLVRWKIMVNGTFAPHHRSIVIIEYLIRIKKIYKRFNYFKSGWVLWHFLCDRLIWLNKKRE